MVGAYAKVHDLGMNSGGSDVVPHTHVLAREARVARMLLEAARSLGATLSPDRVYERFREILGEEVPYDGVIVSSYDATDGTIRCDYAWVDGELLAPDSLPPLKLGPPGHGMQSTVIHSGNSLLTN